MTAEINTLATATPDTRNRYVDALRAASILVVVFGHWLMAGPEMLADGSLRIGHLVAESTVIQGMTWIFQVMPVFFFVGGYANAAGWRSARRRGEAYPTWLRTRLRRLAMPVLPLLVFWTVAGLAAIRFGLDPDLLRAGSQAALVPVWFLATYIVAVALAPLTLSLWERFGWWSIAGLTAAAAVVDVATLGFGVDILRWVNYLFVWNAVHALGYAWADGRIGRAKTRAMIGLGALAVLAGLVAALPYPLAMVGLDAAAVTNSNPPKVTLVFLGLFQFGLLTALEAPARRLLERRRLWTGVIVVSATIMTLYLWHLTAMVAVVGAQMGLDGLGLGYTVNTPLWWATRPLFLAVLSAATLLLILVFRRYERPQTDTRPDPPAWRPILGTILLCAGLGNLASSGIVDDGAVSVLTLGVPFVGVFVGGVIGAGAYARRVRRADAGAS
ncbi:MAG TPA: acyltransferase [Acidimicrobiia bacterium]|nr:acyltransferase [Acidimicrobiia bacterium]